MGGSWTTHFALAGLLWSSIHVMGALASELPPAIQADRLMVQAERQVEQQDAASALATLDAVKALRSNHGLVTPLSFWYRDALTARMAGEFGRAVESATRYLSVAGQEGQYYQEALRLLDAAEREGEAERRQRQAERKERELAARRLDSLERRRQRVEERELGVYRKLRARLRTERNGFSGAFADALRSGGEGPEMVTIPSGRFQMGCKDGRDPQGYKAKCRIHNKTTVPRHRVEIRKFALARHEVTHTEWNVCVAAGGCYQRREFNIGESVSANAAVARGELPPGTNGWLVSQSGIHAVSVTWEEALEYVRWLSDETGENYRLPSEAEWEYAMRAGTRTAYSYGSVRQDRQSVVFPVQVATYGPNPFGLYGMYSNLEEWTQDCWNPSYEGAPRDGSAWMRGDCSKRMTRAGWGRAGGASRGLIDISQDKHVVDRSAGIRVARSIEDS